jgi:uncharacterized protein
VTAPAHPGRMLFVNIPVADVERSKAFFAKLGFSFNPTMTDEAVSAAALAAGGSEADDAEDHGFMYSRSFFDLDGHGWQVMWIDPAAAEEA